MCWCCFCFLWWWLRIQVGMWSCRNFCNSEKWYEAGIVPWRRYDVVHLLNFIDFSATWTWYTYKRTQLDHVLWFVQELIPILTIAKQMSKPLLIIAESIEKEAKKDAKPTGFGPQTCDVNWCCLERLVKSALQIRACWGNSTSSSIQLLTECLADEAPVWSTSRHKSRHPNIAARLVLEVSLLEVGSRL